MKSIVFRRSKRPFVDAVAASSNRAGRSSPPAGRACESPRAAGSDTFCDKFLPPQAQLSDMRAAMS